MASAQTAQAEDLASQVAAMLRRLDVCLDHSVAPDLSTNLSRLYQHMEARLGLPEATEHPAIFDEVIDILDKLWDGFQEANQRTPP